MSPDLMTLDCTPMEGRSALRTDEAQALQDQVPGWSIVDGALQRQFGFADFHRTMDFVNAVAGLAHRQDHHPELAVSWGSCTVRWSTHSVGGLSINDFICARRVDALQA